MIPNTSAIRFGLLQGMGSAGIVLISNFFAVGALFNDSGFELGHSIASTVFSFALPSQVLTAEMYAKGTSIATIAIAVFLMSSRFLPMAVTIVPLLGKPPQWQMLLGIHLMAVTSWVCFMTDYRKIAPKDRFRYYLSLSFTLWMLCVLSTVAGYLVADEINEDILLALLMLNPAYFMCMIIKSLSHRSDTLAVILGMILMPISYHISSDWGVVIAGVVGGSAAFLVAGKKESHAA